MVRINNRCIIAKLMTYCSGSVKAATKYIKSFRDDFAVAMHCVTSRKEGARFKFNMEEYIQLVENSLFVFE